VFTLSSLADADPTGQSFNFSNVSPASDIALQKALERAAGAAITGAAATQANLAVSGLIELITGISLGGLDVSQIVTADLTSSTGAPSAAELALAALASGVIGSQGTGTLNEAITALAGLFTLNADGTLQTTGPQLAAFTDALVLGLRVASSKQPTGALTIALSNASAQAAIFRNIPGAIVVGPPPAAGSDAPVDQSKAFVRKLGAVIGEVAGSTGAQGFGGQNNIGATEAFAAELDAVAAVSSTNATKTFTRLDAALKADAAVLTATDATVTEIVNGVETADGADDGIEYVLTLGTDGSLTATGISSRWPLVEATGGNIVTLTAATATATGETSVDIPSVTLTTTSGTSTLQTFAGSLSFTSDSTATDTAPEGTGAGTLSGTITGSSSTVSYTLEASLTDIPLGIDAGGTYTVTLGFNSPSANDLTLAFFGTVGASLQGYTISAPSGDIVGTVTRDGTTDVVTLTDGTTTLTLTVTDGVVVDSDGIGSLTVGTGDAAVLTGTLDSNGVVTFTDTTILALPAIIFPE
jgi:hypothetical protein